MSGLHLNGWQRLWIVASVLYMGWAFVSWTEPYPSPEQFQREANIASLDYPNDTARYAALLDLANLKSRPDQLRHYRQRWFLDTAMVMLSWPVIAGVALLTAAWVRRGFSGRRRGVRVVEAEIEDP